MASRSHKDTIGSPGFQNWIRAGIGIKYTKQGLESFIDNEAKEFHKSLINILKHSTNTTRDLNKEIVSAHRFGDQPWKNSDQSKWLIDQWEVAKNFLTSTDEYQVIRSANAIDCIGLLDIGINLSEISTRHSLPMGMHGTPLKWVPIAFSKCRTATNEIMCNPSQSLTDVEVKNYLNVMKETLQCTAALLNDPSAQKAVTNLTKLENRVFEITVENIKEGDKQKELMKTKEVVYRRVAVENEQDEGNQQDEAMNVAREKQIKNIQKAAKTHANASYQEKHSITSMNIPIRRPRLRDYQSQLEQFYSQEVYEGLEGIELESETVMSGSHSDFTRRAVCTSAKTSPTILESEMPKSYLYELPSSCYPRYKYFSEHLQRFMLRFKDIMETEEFYKSFSKDEYHYICKESSRVGSMINVHLKIENEKQKITLERHMVKTKPIKKEMPLIKRNHLATCIEKDHPTRICIQIVPFFQYDSSEDSKNKIRYLIRGFVLILYTDDDVTYEESLGDVIQHVLERKSVEVFEKIIRYTDCILGKIGKSDDSKDAKYLQIIELLRFEVFGILRQSKVAFKLPSTPYINPNMKKDILALRGVKGCGTVLGVFTIYFSGRCENEAIVKKILQKYNYDLKYRIETETKIFKCTDTMYSTGEPIRAERKPPSRGIEQYGTLGCFIRQRSRRENDPIYNDLYFITCGHCVYDCQNAIYIKAREEFIPFGWTEHVMYEGDLVKDVAFVKVLQDRVKDCDTSVFRSCGSLSSKNWSFIVDSDLVGLPVYKVGANTRITHGVVASANNLTFIMQESEGRPFATVDDIVFIVEVAGINNQNSFFCRNGDSGSIVCTDDIDHAERVKVVSLLAGSITTKRRGAGDESLSEIINSSYSFNLQRCLRNYNDTFRIQYEPAIEEGNEHETNDGNEDIFD